MDFKTQYENRVKIINNALDDYLAIKDGPGSDIYRAAKYSLSAGGKRIRPVLALAVCDMLGGKRNDVLPYACAIEMIHTYSLIHDDLPSMDNDDYRRGIPSNHKVFGEGMAILAGDALLNKAYELMLSDALSGKTDLTQKIKAMHIIAESAGIDGMIRGQAIDLESEHTEIPGDTLELMHKCKTGALITASVLSSAVICGATEEECGVLREYAENIGIAFQIKDDIMDVKGSQDIMGKSTGKDAASGKSTFVTVYGMEESEKLLENAIEKAVSAIGYFGGNGAFLKDIAIFIKERNS
ncbi:MAG: polyprenyl synthetase family protein [Acetivibrionales bacterium]|jgi:geranylgeranyl diphosphate synthase type II